MKFVGTRKVAVKSIQVSDRLRAVDEDWVRVLAESIGASGLQSPPAVAPLGKGARMRLVAGCHRLAAVRSLGWDEVEVRVYEPLTADPESEIRLLEIDENLIRHELSPFDRAAFLAERKRVYEGLYPQTRHGAQGGRGGRKNETVIFSFSKSTAEKLGLGERAIRRAVRIYSGLSPSSRAEIAGTWLVEKEGQLYALAGLDHDRQRAVLDLMLREDGLTKVAAAEDALQGRRSPRGKNQTQQALDKLIAAWARAPKRAQSGFIDYLAELGLARRV